VVPEARLVDVPPLPRGRGRHRIEGILAAGIVVAVLLVAASAVFLVRAAFSADRSTAELLHMLGAAVRKSPARWQSGHCGSNARRRHRAVAALLTIVVIGDAGSLRWV
jgi:hypothetical protein